MEGQEVSGEIPKEGQVSEEGQEGTGGVQQVDQVGEGEQEGTGGVQQVDQVDGGEQEGTGGVQQVDQVSDIDMEGDEEMLKVPHLKRKTRSSRGSSKAKKGAVKKGGRAAAESEVGFILGFYADTQGRKTRKSPLRSYASPLACLRASPKFCDYPTKPRKRHAARKDCDWSVNHILSGVTFPVS